MQEDGDSKRYPLRYKSGVQSDAKRRYNAGKRECKSVLKALKKFRLYIYSVRFILKLDAKTLITQLNKSATDLPSALITQWLTYIQLFNFNIRYIPGKKYLVTDGLLRRPPIEKDIKEEEEEEDIKEFINTKLAYVRVSPLVVCSRPLFILALLAILAKDPSLIRESLVKKKDKVKDSSGQVSLR